MCDFSEQMCVNSVKYHIINNKKKILVWHSHNFLLFYITVEEYFIICFTFIFNLYYLRFVVDKLPAFIVIVNNF